jgi:hypothetical protein
VPRKAFPQNTPPTSCHTVLSACIVQSISAWLFVSTIRLVNRWLPHSHNETASAPIVPIHRSIQNSDYAVPAVSLTSRLLKFGFVLFSRWNRSHWQSCTSEFVQPLETPSLQIYELLFCNLQLFSRTWNAAEDLDQRNFRGSFQFPQVITTFRRIAFSRKQRPLA